MNFVFLKHDMIISFFSFSSFLLSKIAVDAIEKFVEILMFRAIFRKMFFIFFHFSNILNCNLFELSIVFANCWKSFFVYWFVKIFCSFIIFFFKFLDVNNYFESINIFEKNILQFFNTMFEIQQHIFHLKFDNLTI